MSKTTLTAISTLALALTFAAGAAFPAKAGGQASLGPAPAFTVKDIEGKTIDSTALKGKVVLVNFWATWCPPCREEIPDFVAFYNENKDKGLEIIGFSVDALTGGPATAAALKPFVLKAKISYPVVVASEKIVKAFDPGDAIPTTVIIDRQGIIRLKQVGTLDKAALAEWLKKLS